MKISWVKIFIVVVCFVAAVIGFMVKLPSAFHSVDKELHSLFYFFAAATLNILFSNKNIVWHIVIGLLLFMFGVSIEYAQEYSNKLLHARIHGRFDPEDVKSNLLGILAFSGLWFPFVVMRFVYLKAVRKNR
jgi:hypothetical protein